MSTLRHLIRDHSHLAPVLLVMALLLKAAIPVGFMLSPGADGSITITICPSTAPAAMARSIDHAAMGHGSGPVGQMAMTMGHGQGHDDMPSEQGNKPMHCAFAGLSHAALGGVGIDLLAAAVAFVLLLAVRPTRRMVLSRLFFLRPPMRAPPIAA